MRGISTTRDYLRENNAVEITQTVSCELNMNRYHEVTPFSDDVYGTDATNLELQYFKSRFPVESITLPDRPQRGVAIPNYENYSGGGAISDTAPRWYTSAGMNDVEGVCTYDAGGDFWTLPPRYAYATPSRPYKFFAPATMPTSGALASIPITYVVNPWANKIVIGFEDTINRVYEYDVLVDEGSGIAVVHSDSAPDANGRVTLYRDGPGSWTTTRPAMTLDNCAEIVQIRLDVTAMGVSQRRKRRPHVIEISPRMEADLTDRLIGWSSEFNTDEQDKLTPVGTVSANGGSVSFSNDGHAFDEGNATGASLADIAKKYAKITVTNTLDGEAIQQFEMYAENWTINGSESAEASLFDHANLLQSVDAPDMVLSGVTPTQAIWRTLDMVGGPEVILRRNPGQSEPRIPYFFSESTMTVWDVIKSVCASHQYAAFFDGLGRLNICTKEYLYTPARSESWAFREHDADPIVSDIISHSVSKQEPINKINVKYQPIAKSAQNDPAAKIDSSSVAYIKYTTRQLWSEEGKVLLGVSRLSKTIGLTDTEAWIVPQSLKSLNWGAFGGYFLADSEIIKYDGLEYKYTHSVSNQVLSAVIKNADQLREVYAVARGQVSFSGKLCNLERGQLHSVPADHYVIFAGWSIRSIDTTYITKQSDTVGNYLQICNPKASTSRIVTAYNLLNAASFSTFSVRIKIPNQTTSKANRAGGLVVWAVKDGSEQVTSGMYVELASNESGKKNVGIYKITGGVVQRATGKTYKHDIDEGSWYTLSVKVYAISGGKQRVRAYVNGVNIGYYDTAANPTKTAGIALVAFGRSKVFFDSITATNSTLDSGTFLTARGQLEEALSGDETLQGKKHAYRETFDNNIRQVYVNKVRFDKGPALDVSWFPETRSTVKYDETYAGPLVAKSTDIVSAISEKTPFSATLRVTNISSKSKLLADPNVGSGRPYVYGNIVERYEEVEYKDERVPSIKTYGQKLLDLSGDNIMWINTHDAVVDISNWILDTWSDGPEVHDMSVFANPLVEIGDVVQVEYTSKGISLSERFIITKVASSQSGGGLETEVSVTRLVV